MAHTDPTWNQEYWQIRSGDTVGLNVDSGWAAAENIDATIGTGSLFRIRFKVRDSTGDYAVGVIVKLQVNDGGGWVDCDIRDGATVPPAIVVDSAQYTHGDATSTELLTSTTTYVNGEGLDTSITSGSVSAGNSQETEFEYCLMLMSFYDGPDQNQASDTLDFRLVESTGTIFGGTYANPTITVSETAGYVGGCMVEIPGGILFCDSDGNLYAIIEPSHNTPYNVFSVIKSTDGGDTWREMDGTNRPSTDDLEAVDAVLYDDILHIVHHDGPTVVFHQFHTSAAASNPDTWQTTDESIASGLTTTDQFCAIAYRSDDTIVAFYSRNDGTNDRLYYKIRTSGGVWGSENGLDTTASVNFGGVMCVKEAGSDIIHIAYKDQTNHDLYHKSLSAADSLSARESLTTDASTENCPMTTMVAWEDGGDEKVMICYVDESELDLKSRIITNDGTPGTEQHASDNQVVEDQGTSRQPVADIANDGSTVYLLYADLTDYDLYRDVNANGAGWGTDVEERDEIDADWVRARVFTHSAGNGGAKVLGYIVDEGSGGGTGYIWFDEYTLPAAARTVTLDALTLAGSTPGLTVSPGAVAVLLDALTLASSAETINVSVVANVIVVLDALTLASSTPALIISPGAVAIVLDALTLASSTPALTVTPGAIAVLLDALTLASSAEGLVVSVSGLADISGLGSLLWGGLTGAAAGVTVSLDTLTLASSAETLAVSPGAIAVVLQALTLASSAEALTITPGAASIVLQALTLASSTPGLTITPGAVAILLDALTLASSAEGINVSAGISIVLDALTLASSTPALTVSPGAVAVLLDALTLASSAEGINVSAGILVTLATLTLASSAPALTVSPGAVAVLLDALILTSSAETLTVTSGAVTVVLDALTLASSAPALTVSPGAVAVLLDALTLTSSAETLTVSPGAVVVALQALTLASSAETISIDAILQAIVQLNTLELVSSVGALGVGPGAVAVELAALELTSLAVSLAVALIFKLDVTVSDALANVATIADAPATTATIADALASTVTVSDATL